MMFIEKKQKMTISVKLRSIWWDRPPRALVAVNHRSFFDGLIKEPTHVDIEMDNSSLGKNLLEIQLQDKDDSQTLIEKDQIIFDQLLCIDKIVIDDIDLGNLILTEGLYFPDESLKIEMPVPLRNINTMGWNGTWKLEFSMPFHIWFLENLP